MVVQVLIPVGRGLWAMYLLSTIMVCAAVTSVPQLVDASVRPGGVLPRCTEGDSNDVSLSLFTPLVQRVQIGGGVELTLPLFGVDMVLNLTRAGEIVHHSWRQYSASNDTKTGAIHTGRQAMMFTGHIVGETGSSVWLTLPHGNTLSAVIGGVLLSGESTTLSMQPEADAVSSPSSVVKVTCHTVVADDKALRYHTDDHQHNHEAKRKPHSPVHTQRGRRDGPLSSSHTACPVFVDVDLSFHEQWGGSGTSAQRMERTAGVVAGIIGQVSDLYEAQLSITLPLMGVHIRTTTVSPIPSSGGSELGGYETWLTGDGPSTRSAAASALPRGEGTPTASQSCLNMLLVYRDLGGTLGTANMAVADVGYVGGVCESYLWRDSSTLRYHALNTAIVNGRLSTGEGLSTTQLVSVIGHEIGHLMGAPHTCSSKCSTVFDTCNPSPSQGGRYLMYPTLGSSPNSMTLSSCSRASITSVIQAKGHCFVEPPETTTTTPASTTPDVSTAESTTVPIVNPPADIYTLVGSGCCRTADNSGGTYRGVSATSLGDCEAECSADDSCVAIEYQQSNNLCELHTVPITHVASINICVCYSRTVVTTTTAPSLLPTMTPTNAPSAAPVASTSLDPTTTTSLWEPVIAYDGDRAIHPSNVMFTNAFPGSGSGSGAGSNRQYSTLFDEAARDFTISDIGLNGCFDACALAPTCTGFAWWIGGGGNSKCRSLTELGTQEGSPADKDNMTSYIKLDSATVSSQPSVSPTTSWPSSSPTDAPTDSPSTSSPTMPPTTTPTTTSPTDSPFTSSPTISPTSTPTTTSPTDSPTTDSPSSAPISAPSTAALEIDPPTTSPTVSPTTSAPTAVPTVEPSNTPTTSSPTTSPTSSPTTSTPTAMPTTAPTESPSTSSPSSQPTVPQPTASPTTSTPTDTPIDSPSTTSPTITPTTSPTVPFVPYTEVIPSGCCRTATGGSGTVPAGSAGYFQATQTVCEDTCTAQASCTGYEYQQWSGGKCEIHTSPNDFHHADTVGSGVCLCFRKTPSASPTAAPSTTSPTESPTTMYTDSPTTSSPTSSPTTSSPTAVPTAEPTNSPTTSSPTTPPTSSPTTSSPSAVPTTAPTESPSTSSPSSQPTVPQPTASPTTSTPTDTPTASPSTTSPTWSPTASSPTLSPTTLSPTASPTTSTPTDTPTHSPTTTSPTSSPTSSPTTSSPTASPTTSSPTLFPTESPTTTSPTMTPTSSPTTFSPSLSPTTSSPTSSPTILSPTASPTTSSPTLPPTESPTVSELIEEYVELLPTGCCRTSTGGKGTNLPLFIVTSSAECESACTTQTNPTCTGYEYNEPPLTSPPKCELHTSLDDFHHTASVDGCSCFARTTISSGAQVGTGSFDDLQGSDSVSVSVSTVVATVGVVCLSLMVVGVAIKRVASTRGVALVINEVIEPPLPCSESSSSNTHFDVGDWDDTWDTPTSYDQLPNPMHDS